MDALTIPANPISVLVVDEDTEQFETVPEGFWSSVPRPGRDR